MRLLLQRVSRAEVRVEGRTLGRIGSGLLALVGVAPEDTDGTAAALADKTVDLRIFRDEAGLTNRSLIEVGGELLAVSQFTLFADTRRGRRPSFIRAAPPEQAETLVDRFAARVEARGVTVARGRFGAEMEVEIVNDGPMTVWIDTAADRGAT
jgi:D-tyrosyl-tRNA(Tyr) deacylase